MKNILKYLRTKELLLIFGGGSELIVEGYTDSDFMTDVDNRKSTLRCIFLYNGGVVSRKSFKQSIIVDSIMEVETSSLLKLLRKPFDSRSLLWR